MSVTASFMLPEVRIGASGGEVALDRATGLADLGAFTQSGEM